ncbi:MULTISPECIES: hypothetical protein [unclassified Pseudoalteromonas]|uniref:hypothetical protein n=1 Tax=unclassified Pseudoalteromonas TaxID=194690 RepID=UPI000C0814FB|nr:MULTISPECIES: hypothetical protein [unclassified Pseudoalteromonas]MDP2635594.1 hypothetical protein [Pseudoalteromonas sp. 1_MG-2023]PHN88911.1 hypothetical protein CSC79_15600 [Pseudoalteromonas sp. 3D05]
MQLNGTVLFAQLKWLSSLFFMAEIKGKKVIIEPNSPSEGLIVAFIEVNGAPVELMEYSK